MLRPSRKQGNSSSVTSSAFANGSASRQAGRGDEDDSSGKSKSFSPRLVAMVAVIFAAFLLVGALGHLGLEGRTVGKHAPDTPVNMKLPSAGTVSLPAAANVNAARIDQTKKKILIGFSAEEDSDLLLDRDGTKLHLVFSTDCGSFQHWQSYLLFHSAMKVRQPGHVTRIASGCSDEEAAEARAWHEEHIAILSNRFGLHLTPHFSSVKNADGKTTGDYKFFNKPFGLKHWMEHGEGMGLDPTTGKMTDEDVVVILTDPDMLLLRPITADYSDDRETLIGPRKRDGRRMRVEHGVPFAQTYGLGTQWMTFNLDEIAGPDSPAKKVDKKTASTKYPAGPPYLATARDMHNIAVTWSDFVPRVHKEYPNLLAEMYAFCIAAAHLELPHQLVDSLMVSNEGAYGEGWPLVDNIPPNEVCSFASHPDHGKYAVPSVVHFCQRYGVERSFFGKRKVPHDLFTCDKPLLKEPPMDIGSGKYLHKMSPGRKMERKELSAKSERREAFMVCSLTSAANEAAIFFKNHHCNGSGNMEKTVDMHSMR